MQLSRLTVILAAVGIALFFPVEGFTQASFYEGKTITIIQGRDPGGTGDRRVRAMLPFLKKYIPGSPTIAMEYMPGGGSRKAANHVFRSTSTDGLIIGNLSSGMVSSAVLGETGVLYDLNKFFYLGSPFSSHIAVFVTRKNAGLSSIEKLRAASGIRIGGQSVGFSVYIEARLFAYLIGLKEPRFVTGYGGAEMDLALMRDEIDARASAADSILQRNKDGWKKIRWTFTRPSRSPKEKSIPDSLNFPSWRALPSRKASEKS